MEIIPVLDLLNGVVVRGIAGQRACYRPVRSLVAATPDPVVVLRSLQRAFDLHQFYVADLDAIQFQHLNRCIIAELVRCGVMLMLDRGVRNAHDVQELLDLNVQQIVIALETLQQPQDLEDLVRQFGAEQLVLSLDLKNGQLQTPCAEWQHCHPCELAVLLRQLGLQSMILLDIAAVGMNSGNPTQSLCREVRSRIPDVTLIAGGGIRNLEDIQQLQQAGSDAVLIASALHDGRLSAADLRAVRGC